MIAFDRSTFRFPLSDSPMVPWSHGLVVPWSSGPIFAYLCCLLSAFCFLLPGCATRQASGRLLATTVQTVDAAMQGWAAYVVAGHATPADEARVKAAYERYQLAERAAEEAWLAAAKLDEPNIWKQAAAALRAAQRDLLDLIQSISHPLGPRARTMERGHSCPPSGFTQQPSAFTCVLLRLKSHFRFQLSTFSFPTVPSSHRPAVP